MSKLKGTNRDKTSQIVGINPNMSISIFNVNGPKDFKIFKRQSLQ